MRRLTASRGLPALALLVVGATVLLPWPVAADGLPGEFTVTNRWRTLHSLYSPLPNAAYLTEANYVTAHGAFSRTLGEFYMLELGATVPIGLYQAAGVSWFTLGTASYDAMQGNFQSSGNSVSANDNLFVFSYAINPWRRLSVGLNVDVAQQSLFGEANRAGVGIDVGATYRLLHHPLLGDHVLGIAMANLLPPDLPSTDTGTSLPSEPQAASLHLSLHSTYWEKRLESAVDFSLKDLYARADDFQNSDLTEAGKKMEWDANVRVGAWVVRLINVYGLIGFANTGIKYGGFALGFNLPSVNNGRDLSFLYQMLAITDEGSGYTHTVYLRGDFGRHREEVYARRMARLLNIEPNDLYNRALALYSSKQYWDAYFIFGRIAVEYPDFFKRDWCSYYGASCLENLDMRQAALNEYSRMKSDYPRSAAVSFADLGLMRVYYRQDDNSSVAMQLNRLNQPEVRDSLKYHAFYLMGETHMKLGEFRKARQVFEMVPASHPEFLFAQHSLAIANVINGSTEDAIENLRSVVNAVPHGKAQEEAVNRSLVMLGYLFYELSSQMEGSLSQAVTALRAVPKSSYYYEDALLGLGWTAVKARQWEDCMDAGQSLTALSRRPMLQAEGALLKAYGLMMRKDYVNAQQLLSTAQGVLERYHPAGEDTLAFAGRSYDATRTTYDEVAAKAEQLAAARQSEHVLGLIDSVGAEQRKTKGSIDRYLRFADENRRDTFFGRSVDKIKEDVEYALAIAEKLTGGKAASEVNRSAQDEQKKIDEQIRKLKEQMETLDKPKQDKK
jgi:tetratricopeptide (TPR) repeat protein